MSEIPEELQSKLNELERREWIKLTNHQWYRELSPRVRAIVNHFPPFYIYMMKDTEQFVYITQYHEKKEDQEQPVMLEVKLDEQYNKNLIVQRLILIQPEVLERIELRSIVDTESMVAQQKQAVQMPGLKNRNQALREGRNLRAGSNVENILRNLKKGH